MNKILFIILLGCGSAFCKNTEPQPKQPVFAGIPDASTDSFPIGNSSTDFLPKGFYCHWIGQVGNRPAALEMIRHGRYTHEAFYAHLYFLDTIQPVFLEGSILKTALESEYDVINGRAVLRSEGFKRPTFDVRFNNYQRIACKEVNIGALKGSFTSVDSFQGICERCDGSQVPFEFRISTQPDWLRFKTLSYENQYKLTANTTEPFNGFLTVEALLPDSAQHGSLLVRHAIEEMILPSKQTPQSLQDKLNQSAVQFFESDKPFLEQQPNQLTYRDYLVTVRYNQKGLLSLLLIQKWDVARKHGCRATAHNYDLKANKQIDFETLFLDPAKSILRNQIKRKYQRNENLEAHLESFDFNNFSLTHHGITFISFTRMDSHNGLLVGTQFSFTFEELKDLIRPAFIESLQLK